MYLVALSNLLTVGINCNSCLQLRQRVLVIRITAFALSPSPFLFSCMLLLLSSSSQRPPLLVSPPLHPSYHVRPRSPASHRCLSLTAASPCLQSFMLVVWLLL
ncbi:hypothetical protein M758_8G022500 [Ceratodon purpureus]|nr:hypothetical protein M758_8G022500 [Ceratodon purpureus]